MSSDAGAQTRRYGRAAGLLTAALASAGVLAYLFFAVASHNLTATDYGQIVVLWSLVFLVVSTLFRPVEQLLAKTVAELEEHDMPIRHAMEVAIAIQLALAAVFVTAALVLHSRIVDDLFEGDSGLFWTMVGAVLAFSMSYYARGFFAGSRRMGAYGALLVIEGVVRLVLALAVAVGIAEGMTVVALAVAIAPLASLMVIPIAIVRNPEPAGNPEAAPSAVAQSAPAIAVESGPDFTLAKGGGFAAAVLLIMLSEQVLLNVGVLLAHLEVGAAGAGFIFNVLMLVRAPVVLFQAVAASLLPHLTRLRSRGGTTSEDAFALSVRVTLGVIAVFAATVLLVVAAVGPEVMQIAFGENHTYPRLDLLLIAIGMGFYLAGATLNQAALAQGQARRAAACWIGCAALFVGWNLISPLEAFRTIEIGFAGAAALLAASLFALYRYPAPIPGDEVLPGSSHELEARLAAADEVG